MPGPPSTVAATVVANVAATVADALERVRAATGFLTRLPVAPVVAPIAGPSGGFLARASVAFPVVGAAVGAVGGAIYATAVACALPPLAGALLALAGTAALTGALHEDGLADVCDGIGGGRDRDRRLQIMRDSHNGTFGTLALVFSVGIRAALLAGLAVPGAVAAALIAAGALSRALLPTVMGLMTPARPDGLAAAAGRPSRRQIGAALAVGFAIAWIGLGPAGAILALAVAVAVVAAIARLARSALGGHTGDVLGACQQGAEVAVLAVAVAMASAP